MTLVPFRPKDIARSGLPGFISQFAIYYEKKHLQILPCGSHAACLYPLPCHSGKAATAEARE